MQLRKRLLKPSNLLTNAPRNAVEDRSTFRSGIIPFHHNVVLNLAWKEKKRLNLVAVDVALEGTLDRETEVLSLD